MRLLRWAWRDVRSRWLQVLAIAAIIGLGSGLYAGLGSTATWRRRSNDISYEQLRLHHVRVRLADDTAVAEGTLRDVIGTLSNPAWVTDAEERLVVPTQFDVVGERREVLLPGVLVGAAIDATIDTAWRREGRVLEPNDDGADVMVLEYNVASVHRLAATGTATLAGGTQLRWVGQALHPEWFVVTDPQGGFLSGASFGVGFTSLRTAQRLAGRAGMVNDLVVRVAPGTPVEDVRNELATRLAALVPPIAATVETRDDLTSYHLLYQDIEGDQRVWNAVSLVVLLGAALAASRSRCRRGRPRSSTASSWRRRCSASVSRSSP